MKARYLVASIVLAGMNLPAAFATNGYFSHGYGMKAKGMGGASVAMTHDAMGGANNPATMVWVGDRLDLGIDWFRPVRDASRSGAPTMGGFVQFNGSMGSDKKNFFIPEFGYNKMLNPSLALGVTVYGNGGMNTDYQPQTGQYSCFNPLAGVAFSADNLLCGQGKLGVNLEQLIIAPTLSYKFHPQHSIGIAPLFGYQRFAADGLQAFGGISSNPGSLTNKGHDTSTGWGVRVGWVGKLHDRVTVGATYASEMRMSKFDNYSGLFANGGDFDIPSHFALGVAFQATPALTVALDWMRINYEDVPAVSNSSRTLGCTPSLVGGTGSACLGGSNGLGFGWQDINVVKLGVQYKFNDKLTLRAGYNHGENPIRSEDITFNMLAPGIVRDHLTLGATYQIAPNSELTVAYMHAFEKTVTGASNNPYFSTGGSEEIKMYQDSIGVTWGMKF